ncbi:hypothetical protein HUW51_19015 [Adhaeribacter swui]|uniref:Uncharacterized protein n=1 Tax=Adhaeribacter swui TaxID=2086471 RepID=A0A7G7GC33_9BACT|nr:contractile injection system tape measure protein [Adhaeribacter swui]QNF34717.1 hypothetical protein HUW51_19015 [Adhaeribacter swui]
MHAVAINKEVFEFSCTQEQKARIVQQEFVHYLAPQLHALILKIVTERFPQTNLQIDFLEIDLGQIAPLELSQATTLIKFEQEFTQQLINYKNNILLAGKLQPEFESLLIDNSDGSLRNFQQDAYNPGGAAVRLINKLASQKLQFTLQQEWQLVKTFLETGDVPWWIDKSQSLNLDAIINRVAKQQPGKFKDFLKNQPLHTFVWQRLNENCKPTTREKIRELKQEYLLPEKAGFTFSQANTDYAPVFSMFSREQSIRLKTLFRRLYRESEAEQKKNQGYKILELSGLNWVQQAVLFEWLPAAEFKIVQAYFATPTIHRRFPEKRKVQQALQLLSPLQLNFLLFPGLLPTNPSAGNPALLSKQTEPAAFFKNSQSAPQKIRGLKDLPTSFSGKSNRLFGWAGNKNLPDKPAQENPGAKPLNLENTRYTLPQSTKIVGKPALTIPAKKLSLDDHFTSPNLTLTPRFSSLKPAKENVKIVNPELLVPAPGASKIYSTEIPDKATGPIFKKLAFADPQLKAWCHQLAPKELRQLKRLFTRPHTDRRVLIGALMNQPVANISALFQVLANVSGICQILFFETEKPQKPGGTPAFTKRAAANQQVKRMQQIQAQVQEIFQNLHVPEQVVLQDILGNVPDDSWIDKMNLRRILSQLPPESLSFMQALTELPTADLQLLATLNQSPPENIWQQEQTLKYYVDNAGLCLLAPYLPGLFTHLDYLENKKFKNVRAATRAMQVLQYLVTGKRQAPEYSLPLTKVLCGYHSGISPAGKVRLTSKELAEADSLLQAVIQHWKALKNTSPLGLQQTFLQRPGILTENEKHWTLQVEPRGPDLLLTTIPWGFTLIKLPWMSKMLQVEWEGSAY